MTGQLAAAKMCALKEEDDLEDFLIEIDILSECKHPNVVELHEAFFSTRKLWVCSLCDLSTVIYADIYSVFIFLCIL